jgi:hypothetical protein
MCCLCLEPTIYVRECFMLFLHGMAYWSVFAFQAV